PDTQLGAVSFSYSKDQREGSQLPAPHERSRHWPTDLDRRGRCHRYRRGIRAWARFRGMAWPRAMPDGETRRRELTRIVDVALFRTFHDLLLICRLRCWRMLRPAAAPE